MLCESVKRFSTDLCITMLAIYYTGSFHTGRTVTFTPSSPERHIIFRIKIVKSFIYITNGTLIAILYLYLHCKRLLFTVPPRWQPTLRPKFVVSCFYHLSPPRWTMLTTSTRLSFNLACPHKTTPLHTNASCLRSNRWLDIHTAVLYCLSLPIVRHSVVIVFPSDYNSACWLWETRWTCALQRYAECTDWIEAWRRHTNLWQRVLPIGLSAVAARFT